MHSTTPATRNAGLERTRRMIDILVVDDHPIVREGLVAILEAQQDFNVIAEGNDGAEAIALYDRLKPDVVLIDLQMPNVDGVQAIQQIREGDPEAKIVVLTAYDTDERILQAVQAGARGYLLKGAPRDEIFRAIRVVHMGGSLLEPAVAGKLLSHVGGIMRGESREEELTSRELDVLIGTDVISEGQNLQDCDYLINYDIHWNPVRIIQRFGRIDRIGSTNNEIQLVNFWPDISLDEYINLKERVENRMVIADLASTADDNVLTLEDSDAAFRKEQLRKLQDEVIELEDVRTGVSITDLGLNDFRMDLLGYIKEHGDLDTAPRGLHAVIPADPSKGLRPGVIFALRNLTADADQLAGKDGNRGNRLHPHYLIYLDAQGEVIANHTEAKHLLDLLRAGCRPHEEPVTDVVGIFNAETSEGAEMSKYSALLTDAIHSMIDVTEERDIDSLFTGGSTTALTQTIAGLDDFELTAFVAVVAPEDGGAHG